MTDKIKSFKKACKIVKELQEQGKRVVFCHGFFDILHRGHVTLLVEAKKLGDILVVGVEHDNNAKVLKGSERPINDHDSRMFVLANLEPVDLVFLIPSYGKVGFQSEFYCRSVYEKLRPNIVASCIRAGKYGLLKKRDAERIGANFVDIKQVYYKMSTTKITKALGLD